MENKYLITASGIGKKSEKPYSMAQKIIDLPTVSFLDKLTIFLDEIRPIGSVVEITQSIAK